LFVGGFFVEKDCLFGNDVNFFVDLLERFDFLKVFLSETVIDFESPGVRVEIKQGFVFVRDGQFVTGGKFIDNSLIIIQFVDDVDGSFFLCVDVAKKPTVGCGEKYEFVDEFDSSEGQFKDVTGLSSSIMKCSPCQYENTGN
jgi:hypothetical protein